MVELLETDHRMTAEEAEEMNVNLYLLESVIEDCEKMINDTGKACIASYFPKAYALTKRLFGLRDNGLDLEETKELLRDNGVIKPNKWGNHGGMRK